MITLFNLFGEPQVLAFRHTVVRRDYTLILNWLRSVEALFRQLLLIEASHYAPEIAQSRPRAKHKRKRREMTFTDENPDAWRVTFRVMERGHPRPHDAEATDQGRCVIDSADAGEDARLHISRPRHSTQLGHWPSASKRCCEFTTIPRPTPNA